MANAQSKSCKKDHVPLDKNLGKGDQTMGAYFWGKIGWISPALGSPGRIDEAML